MAICWERAVLLAFCSCCSYFMPSKLYVFLSHLVSRAGCGIRLHRFLSVAISFTLFPFIIRLVNMVIPANLFFLNIIPIVSISIFPSTDARFRQISRISCSWSFYSNPHLETNLYLEDITKFFMKKCYKKKIMINKLNKIT